MIALSAGCCRWMDACHGRCPSENYSFPTPVASCMTSNLDAAIFVLPPPRRRCCSRAGKLQRLCRARVLVTLPSIDTMSLSRLDLCSLPTDRIWTASDAARRMTSLRDPTSGFQILITISFPQIVPRAAVSGLPLGLCAVACVTMRTFETTLPIALC